MTHKTVIEVNQEGELYIALPDDLVEELVLETGDVVYINEDNGSIVLTF